MIKNSSMGMAQRTIVPLSRFAGHGRRVLVMVLGSVAIVSVAALVHELVATTEASVAVRAVASIAAGVLALAAVLFVMWATSSSEVLRLEVSEDGIGIVTRHGSTEPCSLDRLEIRRLAYLTHEGGAGQPHVMTLEIRGLGRRPLQICAPNVRGGWPQPDGQLFSPPEYELEPKHWTVLCAMLETTTRKP
jgi:hypothetical protein